MLSALAFPLPCASALGIASSPPLGALARVPARAALLASATETRGEVFCNRALNMQHIQAIGFDMDYTLAEYIPETFDLLAYDGAVHKLLGMGYPEAIKDLKYDPDAYQRGLVIDKKRGNLIKLDRHKYVKVAYHGLRKMTSEERKRVYSASFETPALFTPPDFASVDTLFQTVDVTLFCQLVTHKEKHPEEIPQSFATIFKNVRRAVDLCHCDGVIKDAVALQPSKYIVLDPKLPKMLTRLKAAGKQLFVVTNSLYDYTDCVLTYLLGKDWVSYFDLVICGARKPGFLLDPYLPLFKVHPDNSLSNMELGGNVAPQAVLEKGRVYQGGNWNHLHMLLGIKSGARLMYVGDHMYSDILRSKRTLGWRTLLIVPELDQEMNAAAKLASVGEAVEELREQRASIEERIAAAANRRLLVPAEGGDSAAQECDAEIASLHVQLQRVSLDLACAILRHHEGFHPEWGRLFKAGHQNSRWAQQVHDYACLYTSHVTNLADISPDLSFHALSDLMPHDRAHP